MRHFLRVATLIAVQLAVMLALLEVAGRVIDPIGISYYPETARYLDTLVQEEPIGYRNRPGLEGRFYGAQVKINSIGLREREIGAKAAGEYRILVMGDSVPFGVGVRFEDSLPQQVERILGERNRDRKFRTVNMGVPSYNTEQELIQLQTLGMKLAPDAVILLFANNDIEPKRWVLDKRQLWYVDWSQRSYALSLLYVFFREAREKIGFPKANAQIAGLTSPVLNLAEYRPDSLRWKAIETSLAEMHALVRKAGLPFVVFSMGEGPVVLGLLQGVAAKEGFPLVNVVRHADPRWKGKDEKLFRNSQVDGHPTPLGNEALATLIVENLEKLKVIGGN